MSERTVQDQAARTTRVFTAIVAVLASAALALSAGALWPLAVIGDLIAIVLLWTAVSTHNAAGPAITHGATAAILLLDDGVFKPGVLATVAVFFACSEALYQAELVQSAPATADGKLSRQTNVFSMILVAGTAAFAMVLPLVAVLVPSQRWLTLAVVVGAAAVVVLLHRGRASVATLQPPTPVRFDTSTTEAPGANPPSGL